MDGNVSNVKKVTYGTAQSSILGPLIFIIYVNDVFNEIQERDNIIMYADNTLLIGHVNTVTESISMW